MRYVLAAFDGSPASRRAAWFAQQLAADTGARLHLLAVATYPALAFDVGMDQLVEQQLQRCEVSLEALRRELTERSHSRLRMSAANDARQAIRLALRTGVAAEEIVRYAQEFGVGRIVVGSRWQWFRRWPASHTARRILANAPCAVTVVGPRGSVMIERARLPLHDVTARPERWSI